MRLLITVLLVSLAVACSARPAPEEDYAYEDDAHAEAPATPSTKAPPPSRHGLVGSRTARGPSPLIRGAKTTAAPPKVAEPEVVNEPEDIDEGALDIEEVVPVTTEAPKKGLVKGMAVRPFRSNQDLLAALKRKRQQEHNSGGVSTHPPTVTTASPVEVKPNSKGSPTRSNSNNNSSSGRRTFSRPNKATTAAVAEVADEVEAPKKPAFPSSNRRFAARGKPAAPAPVSEDAEEVEADEQPSRSGKSFSRGGRRV